MERHGFVVCDVHFVVRICFVEIVTSQFLCFALFDERTASARLDVNGCCYGQNGGDLRPTDVGPTPAC